MVQPVTNIVNEYGKIKGAAQGLANGDIGVTGYAVNPRKDYSGPQCMELNLQ